jgi:hypothetical protein
MLQNGNGDIEFETMQEVSMLFNARSSYGFLATRLKENLQWIDDWVDIIMQWVIDVGSYNGPRIKRLVSISGPAKWNNYVLVVIETEVRALDLIVSQVVRETSPQEPSPIKCGASFEEVPLEVC